MGVYFCDATAPTTQTKEVLRCSFDAAVAFDHITNITFADDIFAGNCFAVNGPSWSSASQFNDNFIALGSSGTFNMTLNSIENCYVIYTTFAGSSGFLSLASNAVAMNCIFDSAAPSNSSDFCLNAASGGALTALDCMILQAPGGNTVGTLFGYGAGPYTAEHNLRVGFDNYYGYGMIGLGFGGGAAQSGEVASFRSNILYSPTATAKVYGVSESNGSTYTLDAVTHAGYNAYLNPSNGTVKYNAGTSSVSVPGYSGLEVTATGTPPANTQVGMGDFTADPQFADPSLRNFIAWGHTVMGTANTYAGAFAALAANPSLIPSMMQWVRAGYAPTNPAYANATYPGDTLMTDANGNPLGGTVGPMAWTPAQTSAAIQSAAPIQAPTAAPTPTPTDTPIASLFRADTTTEARSIAAYTNLVNIEIGTVDFTSTGSQAILSTGGTLVFCDLATPVVRRNGRAAAPPGS